MIPDNVESTLFRFPVNLALYEPITFRVALLGEYGEAYLYSSEQRHSQRSVEAAMQIGFLGGGECATHCESGYNVLSGASRGKYLVLTRCRYFPSGSATHNVLYRRRC